MPLVVKATAYDACHSCCGKVDGITASGNKAQPWYTIAVDPEIIPRGSKVYVPALNRVFTAEDTGGKIKGYCMDIFMSNHQEALRFGMRNIEIYV